MSAETPAYSPLYIKAWTVLSFVLAVIFFGMLIGGQTLLQVGGIVWSLLRWLASPII